MGIPSEMREFWTERRKNSFLIASPAEKEKRIRAEKCSQEGVKRGAKAAAIACVVTTIPTLAAVRYVPWAKAHLNTTGQTLIISAASIAAYFVVAEKTTLECAKRNNRALFEKTA